jgi:hypothetical protein
VDLVLRARGREAEPASDDDTLRETVREHYARTWYQASRASAP